MRVRPWSMLVGIVLVTPFIMAPPLGFDCGGCDLRPVRFGAWMVEDQRSVDAGFADVSTHAFRVEVTVNQLPDQFEDRVLTLEAITSPPKVNCGCGQPCTDAFDHEYCPCVDSGGYNLFMATFIEGEDAGVSVTRSCGDTPWCSQGNTGACAQPVYRVETKLSDPSVTCDRAQGTCVLGHGFRFNRPTTLDYYTVALESGSFRRQPEPDAGWRAGVTFHAFIAGPVETLCETCAAPLAPDGLKVSLEVTEVP